MGNDAVSTSDLRDDGRDPAAFLTMINTLRRRRSVPEELFYAYWRDAHVQIAARLPGIHSLWTHWVRFDEGELWPHVEGVEWQLAEHLRFDGVPEPVFLAGADVERFVTHMAPLMADEVNIFEETISYPSMGAHSRTVVDRLVDPAPAGDQGVLRLLVFLQKRDDVELETFREWVAQRFAPALASDDLVLKVRHHLPEPYDDDAVVLDAAADTVSHAKSPADQYQAVLEVVVADRVALRSLAGGRVWAETVADQQQHLKGAHAFHAHRTYCMRFLGELTTAGLRTAAVAEQIAAIGAANQLQPDVRHLIETGQPL